MDMGLFFFKKEIEREQFAQRLDALELRLEQLEKQQIALASKIAEMPNEIAKQIQRAKAVEKAHETNPSFNERIRKRMKYKGTWSQAYYDKPFEIAMKLSDEHIQSDIALKLNSLGYRTPYGQEFKQVNVSDLLKNEWLLKRFKTFQKMQKNKFEPVDFLYGIQ